MQQPTNLIAEHFKEWLAAPTLDDLAGDLRRYFELRATFEGQRFERGKQEVDLKSISSEEIDDRHAICTCEVVMRQGIYDKWRRRRGLEAFHIKAAKLERTNAGWKIVDLHSDGQWVLKGITIYNEAPWLVGDRVALRPLAIERGQNLTSLIIDVRNDDSEQIDVLEIQTRTRKLWFPYWSPGRLLNESQPSPGETSRACSFWRLTLPDDHVADFVVSVAGRQSEIARETPFRLALT